MIDHDGDRQVLQAMAAGGADLTKPAHTIHYLYLPSRETADGAAEELRKEGYDVTVERAPAKSLMERLVGSKEYSCVAETRAVPEESAVFATSDYMNELAARHGGNYDGWEASIER